MAGLIDVSAPFAATPINPLIFHRALHSSDPLVDLLPIGLYVCDCAGAIVQSNRKAHELWGYPAIEDGPGTYFGATRVFDGDGVPLAADQSPMAEALRTGKPVRDRVVEIERPDGVRLSLLVNVEPLFDVEGGLAGGLGCFQDITALKRVERAQQKLIGELNHRVKNTLATVQSLAVQTLRGKAVPPDVRDAFEARLLALSRAHDHLSRRRWEGADFSVIIRDIFAPFDVARVRLVGGSVKLRPKVGLTLSMVLHELAGNATNHGALSSPGGRVDVSWRVADCADAPHLRIQWQESGGPAVSEPVRRGFGSRLLEMGVTHELNGSARILFDPAGVRCEIDVPLPDGT